MTTVPVHRFRAIWPVIDDTLPTPALLAEALDDLPAVGLRHGVRVLPKSAVARIAEGRTVPGSGGAQTVVVIDVAAVRIADIPEDDDAADERTEPTPTGACGTNAGYQRHQKRHERPCDDCRAAHRAYYHARQQRQREVAA